MKLMSPGSIFWNLLTVPVCMKRAVLCANQMWPGLVILPLFSFSDFTIRPWEIREGCQEQSVQTQQSILPLIPLTSLRSVLGSKAGIQTPLLKHGIDGSHLYLCQIYQNISGLFGLGETFRGQGRLNLQRGS